MFELITSLIAQTGYLGIALLMLAENLFPPIPSELIMPLAGFTAARGELSLLGVLLAGTIGSLAGALLWYEVGRRIGVERLRRWAGCYGRWFTMAPEQVDRAVAWFQRHGALAVLVGRLVPAIRTLISVPAGIAGMKLPAFLAWTTAGTALWTDSLPASATCSRAATGQWRTGKSSHQHGRGGASSGYLYRIVTFRPHPVS